MSFKVDKFVLAISVSKNCLSMDVTKSVYLIKSPGAILYLLARILISESDKFRLKKPVAIERPEMNLSSIHVPFLSLSKSSKNVLILICFFHTYALIRASIYSTVGFTPEELFTENNTIMYMCVNLSVGR